MDQHVEKEGVGIEVERYAITRLNLNRRITNQIDGQDLIANRISALVKFSLSEEWRLKSGPDRVIVVIV